VRAFERAGVAGLMLVAPAWDVASRANKFAPTKEVIPAEEMMQKTAPPPRRASIP